MVTRKISRISIQPISIKPSVNKLITVGSFLNIVLPFVRLLLHRAPAKFLRLWLRPAYLKRLCHSKLLPDQCPAFYTSSISATYLPELAVPAFVALPGFAALCSSDPPFSQSQNPDR